ncbi:purine-cytosine permease family protein [Rhodococcus koreensis]
MTSDTTGPDVSVSSTRGLVEQRTIEYIPADERHGKPWHVTPVWFTSTSNLATLSIGTIGVLSGLGLGWSVLAIALGSAFGTIFSAFHASQGPQLGMPQLIQSRPQYGYRGAVLIYVLSLFTYVGFSVFGLVLMGQALEILVGIPTVLGMIVSFAVAVTVAAIGYDFVHAVARWVSWAFLICFLVITIFGPSSLPAVSVGGDFEWKLFLAQAAACAAANLAWAPYVSDYTRYLPHMSLKSSFFSTFVGMTVAAIWIESVAAVVVSAFQGGDIVESMVRGGDTIFSGFGTVLLILGLIGTLYLVAMNSYGGSLAVLTIVDSFRPIRSGAAARIGLGVLIGAVALFIAVAASNQVVDAYSAFLTVLLYLLAPWTATNLVDFFWVRRGHYSIREIFNPVGMYGSWNWRGYAAYGVSLLCMLPFVDTEWFTGPVAAAWGFDIAPYVGIVAAGAAYLVFSRSIDLAEERRHIEVVDAGLSKVVQ